MTSQAERATSFGEIADDYDRLRPGPPAPAVSWLVPQGCQIAIDLAAGTGLFSRALAGRVERVVAVEPDERMGAVLRARSPGVLAVAGRAERLPLRDASADAVLISSAWHWMDPVLAVPEIGRVLRNGGRFAVIWTSRDRTADWIRLVDQLREPGWENASPNTAARHGGAPAPALRRDGREVRLPGGSPFRDAEATSFTFSRAMSVDDFVDMIGTYSRIITASPADRARTLARVREALLARFPGAAQIEVPMRSVCWRATRTSRPGRAG